MKPTSQLFIYFTFFYSTKQPWPFGHATRTTFNLGLSATLREQPSTLAFRPRYANNLQPNNL
ncbi:hypothetical protein [Moorena producens]|uniref:hypothetical protein n=1 Tax=Moorena producens TaxID=1155739 RepID=UPI003C76D2E6